MLDKAMYLSLHHGHNMGKQCNATDYKKEFGFLVLIKKRLSANVINFFTCDYVIHKLSQL